MTPYKHNIIEQIYKDPQIRSSCDKLFKDRREDALHEIVLILSQKTDAEIQAIGNYPNIVGYCKRVLFYQRINKYETLENYGQRGAVDLDDRFSYETTNIDHLKKIEAVMDYVETESMKSGKTFYAPRLLLEYANSGSIEKLSKATGIPKASIHKTLTAYINFLRTKFHIND